MSLSNERAIALWNNARDSIRHSLEHFSELSRSNSLDYHNKKWIILSIHHSAEIFSYMLLKELDENNSVFLRKGRHYYPGLLKAIKVLLHPDFNALLTDPEKKLLKLFRKLDIPRNKIIHGEMPENIDVSVMAMALIGISRIAHTRCGESADEIVQQYPTIQRDVVEAVHWNKLEEYKEFIEAFVQDYNKDRHIPECPSCGACAVVNGHCEACFEEIEEKVCPNCNEEVLIVSSIPAPHYCSVCDNDISI